MKPGFQGVVITKKASLFFVHSDLLFKLRFDIIRSQSKYDGFSDRMIRTEWSEKLREWVTVKPPF